MLYHKIGKRWCIPAHTTIDIEQWRNTFGEGIAIKYSSSVHAKMIIVDGVEMIV